MAIIDEDEFLKMIATRAAGQGLDSPASGKKAPTTPKGASQKAKLSSTTSTATTSTTTPTKKKSPEPKKIDIKSHSKKLEMVQGNNEPQLPWVDKYKPTNLKQVIGKHFISISMIDSDIITENAYFSG